MATFVQSVGGTTVEPPISCSDSVLQVSAEVGRPQFILVGSSKVEDDEDTSEKPIELTIRNRKPAEDRPQQTAFVTKKRRETLVRRPSYRKILTDLGGSQEIMISEEKNDSVSGNESSGSDDVTSCVNISSSGGYQPAQVISTSHPLPNLNGVSSSHAMTSDVLHTMSMGGVQQHHHQQRGPGGAIVQYAAASQEGSHFFVPTAISGSTVVVGGGQGNGQPHQTMHVVEESNRKREMRLMKNREAARECRRKKKEYIKCLENRVAVLENQNKALIEELKSLKELYTGKQQVHKVEILP